MEYATPLTDQSFYNDLSSRWPHLDDEEITNYVNITYGDANYRMEGLLALIGWMSLQSTSQHHRALKYLRPSPEEILVFAYFVVALLYVCIIFSGFYSLYF